MSWLLVLTVALLLSVQANAGVTPSNRQAGVSETFSIGDWQGSASYGQDGRFQNCLIVGSYLSGVSLGFSVDRDYGFSIAAHDETWKLVPGETMQLFLKIDRLSTIPVVARAMDRDVVFIEFDDTEKLFDHLRYGYVLTIFGDRGSLDFNFDQYEQSIKPLGAMCDRSSAI